MKKHETHAGKMTSSLRATGNTSKKNSICQILFSQKFVKPSSLAIPMLQIAIKYLKVSLFIGF